MLTIDWDALKALLWALLGTSGALTWPHHDAAGLATYILCRSGVKLWSYLVPASTKEDDMKLYHAMVEGSLSLDVMNDLATPANVLLTPGTLLCVPSPFASRTKC